MLKLESNLKLTTIQRAHHIIPLRVLPTVSRPSIERNIRMALVSRDADVPMTSPSAPTPPAADDEPRYGGYSRFELELEVCFLRKFSPPPIAPNGQLNGEP